ncbi:hypothetical protein [Alicyclobacillus sp.]|uniref:hypothetical protein n=1 Tax=Alicyclobacillus sp. TaxID=61169 RepID=UPI0025C40B30|nr:hypothetical protein [Alicyclobacillus sp.]MCL6516577.1 hypothetical protein [Alicyclobacillus sp.]
MRSMEEGLRLVSNWLDEQGDRVLRWLLVAGGDLALAHGRFQETFVHLCRRPPRVADFAEPADAVLAAAFSVTTRGEAAGMDLDADAPDAEPADAAPDGDGASEGGEARDEEMTEAAAVLCEVLRPVRPLDRAVWLTSIFCGPDLARLERVVLLPGRRIQACCDAVAARVAEGLAARGIAWPKTAPEQARWVMEQVAEVRMPDWLRTRTEQWIRATHAQLQAERHHRGPVGWTVGVAALGVFGLGAVAWGAHRPPVPAAAAPAPVSHPAVPGIPAPLQGLPATVDAQFRLSGEVPMDRLRHAALAADGLYLAQLQLETDRWPAITLQKVPYSASGSDLNAALEDAGRMEMVPPMNDLAGQAVNWSVSDWSVHISGDWAVAVVTWKPSTGTGVVEQLYGLYRPTSASGLLLSVGPVGSPPAVAVGGGRVVLQSAEKPAGATGGPPIQVYTLTGEAPLRALVPSGQLNAPFGVMDEPAIVGGTLVFQGIRGQSDGPNPVTTAWYTLSWTGQLARYVGPPVDGQPHWPVRGQAGNLWWCETTPDEDRPGELRVWMGTLSDASADQANQPAGQLESAVPWFTADDQRVAWVQTTGGVTQLVVATVN